MNHKHSTRSASVRRPVGESCRSRRLLRRSSCHGSIGEGGFFSLRLCLCLGLVCAVGISTRADIITVTNTNDSGPGSLRQALADANDSDTINFAVSGTISLTSSELLVNTSLTISGPGAGVLTVDGNATYRVFH